MDISGAVQTVKKELESLFGATLATSIIAIARTKANAPLIGMTPQNFNDLVDQVCGDNRVQSMLGGSGTRDKASSWKKLLG